jgi:curved DNA-binding protein CbpA
MALSDARVRTPKLVSRIPDARAFRLSTSEGFLLSLVDGHTSEAELALVTAREITEVRASLSKLQTLGLISIEEVLVPPRTSSMRPAPATAVAPAGRALSDPASAMAEDIDLEPKLRMDLLSLHSTLDQLDHYALLGLDRSADKQTTKRAYYELAAKFHPDRYFRKRLGSFKIRMEAVFSRLTLALETLSVPEKRAEYDAYLDEQRRLRGIESVLADAAAESRRAHETVERVARAEEPTPLAPPVAPRLPTGVNFEARPSPGPIPAASDPDPAARREAFARKLLGSRSASMPPAPRTSNPPTTTADAMEALRRRYEERISAVRNAEARKYAARGEEAARTNQVAKAASAFEVAHGLAPEDDELRRKAAAARTEADAVLGRTYRGQAEYEEKNGQWAEAARSWGGACKARPDDAMAHRRAANATMRAGTDLEAALSFAQRACTLDPASVPSRITLGNVFLALGRAADAIRELETAARLAPTDDSIQQMLKKARKGA